MKLYFRCGEIVLAKVEQPLSSPVAESSALHEPKVEDVPAIYCLEKEEETKEEIKEETREKDSTETQPNRWDS